MKITQQFKSKLYTYFVKRLGGYNYRNGWIRIPICPYCGREQKMGVNLTTYRTNCFRCGEHPSPAQMIMDIEKIETYSEFIAFLNHGDFDEYTFEDQHIEMATPKPIILPEGFKLITQGKSHIAEITRSYIQKRGFSAEELSKHGVGYCTKGEYFGYLILPFYTHGKLTYWNARLVIGNGPRYNNPPKDVTGLGKEFLIFNSDALELYNSVYICEGVFNALTIGERAIATMGKSVSRVQVNMLIKSPVKRFILLLDPDAKSKAIELALKLIPFKPVKVVYLPDGEDVNSIGKLKTMRLVYQTRYQSYKDLIRMKNEL